MKKTIIWVGLLVVVLVLAGVGYSFLSTQQSKQLIAQTEAQSSASSEEKEPVMLPSFTITDTEGNPVESSTLTSKPTVINFWATWCAYCKKELPDFQTAYETYGDRINFVMIDAVDGHQETVEKGKQYIADNGYTFPVYFDTDMEAVISCGVTGFPATLFVSAEGEVLLGWPGYMETDQLNKMLEALVS
ncbi:MAG: TlpA disulfide reductase family protein [Butyricicoccus sp.]|nr:TlpA disulfide reductase family protein [Butyricicoccus sp.]